MAHTHTRTRTRIRTQHIATVGPFRATAKSFHSKFEQQFNSRFLRRIYLRWQRLCFVLSSVHFSHYHFLFLSMGLVRIPCSIWHHIGSKRRKNKTSARSCVPCVRSFWTNVGEFATSKWVSSKRRSVTSTNNSNNSTIESEQQMDAHYIRTEYQLRSMEYMRSDTRDREKDLVLNMAFEAHTSI